VLGRTELVVSVSRIRVDMDGEQQLADSLRARFSKSCGPCALEQSKAAFSNS